MKQKFVWKVVRIDENNEFISIVSSSEFSLKYKIGKETKPNIGKIFVFKTRKDARRFKARDPKFCKLLKCSYTGEIQSVSRICDTVFFLESFWKSTRLNFPFLHTMPAPIGTVFVDSVTPIEISH